MDNDGDGDVYYNGAEDAVTINDMQRMPNSDSEDKFRGFERRHGVEMIKRRFFSEPPTY